LRQPQKDKSLGILQDGNKNSGIAYFSLSLITDLSIPLSLVIPVSFGCFPPTEKINSPGSTAFSNLSLITENALGGIKKLTVLISPGSRCTLSKALRVRMGVGYNEPEFER
jgi:hypothetical protein